MADATNLMTTVKNPLNSSRYYGYLGYHGVTLASGTEFSFPGSLIDYLMAKGPAGKRYSDALQRDLIAGKIVVITTPQPILKDATTKVIKALNLNGGTLGVVDPSWGAYTDS